LELVEKGERFAAFFRDKIVLVVSILNDMMNEIIAGSIFILSTADAQYCICIRNQDMAFSNVNNSEKQAKYEQEERKSSCQSSWQLKRLYLVFLCLPTATTMDMLYWEHAVLLQPLGFHGNDCFWYCIIAVIQK